jgi:hypothetical protein
MKTNYEIQTDKKGLVATFDTKEDADKYLIEHSDKNYSIKEKKVTGLVDYLIFGLAFLLGKYLGLMGFLGVLVGYAFHFYLVKKINKYLSILISVVFGLITYVIGFYILTETLK